MTMKCLSPPEEARVKVRVRENITVHWWDNKCPPFAQVIAQWDRGLLMNSIRM